MRQMLAVALAIALCTRAAAEQTLTLAYIGPPGEAKQNALPLDEAAPDEGLAGAELGLLDDNGTGRFTDQDFALKQLVVEPHANLRDALRSVPPDVHFVVANLPAACTTSRSSRSSTPARRTMRSATSSAPRICCTRCRAARC